jgi:hypothetical protein
MRLTLLLFFLLTLFFSSCKKYKPADEAFFLKGEPVSVVTTSLQGSPSHKITDLGLYVNGQFLGSYPAGSKLPVISKGGNVKIQLRAGIKNNGISDTRITYPFYEFFEIDTFVAGGSTITRPLNFRYNSAVTFTWTENFDTGPGYTITKSPISDSNFVIAGAAESFEGRSMRIGLSGGALVAQVESTGPGFTLPQGTADIYLEMNYKCNEEFEVGLIDESLQQRPVFILNPQTTWNKIYIFLAEAVHNPSYSSRCKIYFRMLKRDTQEHPEFFLDNIKLIYL